MATSIERIYLTIAFKFEDNIPCAFDWKECRNHTDEPDCLSQSRILMYYIVSSRLNAAQSKVTLLGTRADGFFCSKRLGRLQW